MRARKKSKTREARKKGRHVRLAKKGRHVRRQGTYKGTKARSHVRHAGT